MEYTTNKNLAKPNKNEYYALSTVNENMDKIDTALKTNDDAIAQLTEKCKHYVQYFSQSGGATVKVERLNKTLVVCRHIGGDNYLIAMIVGNAAYTVASVGDIFSIEEVTNNYITIKSTTRYWVCSVL